MAEGDWYYCLDHHRVEPYQGCRSASRLGPYSSQDEAALALHKVEARNEDWESDPRFNDDPEDAAEAAEKRERWSPFGN